MAFSVLCVFGCDPNGITIPIKENAIKDGYKNLMFKVLYPSFVLLTFIYRGGVQNVKYVLSKWRMIVARWL